MILASLPRPGASPPALRAHAATRPLRGRARAAAQAPTAAVRVADAGVASNRGTARKVNEDRHALEVSSPPTTPTPDPWIYTGVYDRHGGAAVADWLVKNLEKYVRREWQNTRSSPEAALTAAFLAADKKLLAPKAGFFGVGERGIGGAKCGSTAAFATVHTPPGGVPTLVAANVGDARVLLRRADGTVLQVTTDHVPDDEDERARVERTNPNPRLPLVRFIGGTWRVGGLLALSRAFGDAHLKGSDQFEGLSTGGNSYGSGFGVTAEPTVTQTPLTPPGTYTHIIIASDGLNANVERGGGGGIDNATAGAIAAACGDASEASAALAAAAAEFGSTDDVTVIVLKLE